MSEIATTPSVSDEAKRKLAQARRNLDRIKGEEEARKRRVAMRTNRQEFAPHRRQPGSAWWIKPLLGFAIICAALIWVAWNWPAVQKFLA